MNYCTRKSTIKIKCTFAETQNNRSSFYIIKNRQSINNQYYYNEKPNQ